MDRVYIGHQDKYGIEIHLGDILKTDEANWCGTVIRNPEGGWMLVDSAGGYSTAGDWEKYELVGERLFIHGLSEKAAGQLVFPPMPKGHRRKVLIWCAVVGGIIGMVIIVCVLALFNYMMATGWVV